MLFAIPDGPDSTEGTSPAEAPSVPEVVRRIRPGRAIDGIAALLLPFDEAGEPDWTGFAELLRRTADSGLRPAVNMDTGYVHLLSDSQRARVLDITSEVMAGRAFVAGAFVEGCDGDPVKAYAAQVRQIQRHGGTPILFQSSRLKKLDRRALVQTYRNVASECEKCLAFELGEMFAPFGEIYGLDTVSEIMQIERIEGLKHSSLDRRLEWQRLRLRDRLRPDFRIYTGNDLAIDMVMYGSDYLLGLATFSVEAFALRDRLWREGNSKFFAVNDLLQSLGSFAFRKPIPAYRHSAAQFLQIRGVVTTDRPHPMSPTRPAGDREILAEISNRLDQAIARANG